mmetsp:Transcript_5460/g.17500  ORF Transcript_5460/g.17500 Transcript_5460/m.17500 type:complete len:472 (-) Transcript_5460:90-1505(-)
MADASPPRAPARRARLPCQFFVMGTCKHASDADCTFTHDRDICRPGALAQPCTHYLAGYCRNGSHCLNQHDREARDAALRAKVSPQPAQAPVFHPVAIQRTARALPLSGAAQLSCGAATPRANLSGSASGLPTQSAAPAPAPGVEYVTLRRSHAQPAPDADAAGAEEQAPTQSQSDFHAALQRDTDENMYFYGTLPAAQPGSGQGQPQPAQQPTVDWHKVVADADTSVPHELRQIWEAQQARAAAQAAHEESLRRLSAGVKSAPPCKFFRQGNCRFGASCHFSHDTPDFDRYGSPGVDMEALERAASNVLECSICLERIVATGDGRFGLLTGCDHVFCLKCIKNWRTSEMSHREDQKELVRRCPLCREPSFFVIPCDRYVRDPVRKQALIDEYRQGMGTIHCKHFARGKGTCPFGTSCFYKHVYEDGREQDPGELRTYKDAEGRTKVDGGSARLGAYFEQALRVSQPPVRR